MARHKDKDWNLPDKAETWEQVQTALLMDIRDQLKALNMALGCHRIQRMFTTIERIDRRVAKKLPLKGKSHAQSK